MGGATDDEEVDVGGQVAGLVSGEDVDVGG